MARQFFSFRLTCPKVVFLLLAANIYYCGILIFKSGKTLRELPNFGTSVAATGEPSFLYSASMLVSTQESSSLKDGAITASQRRLYTAITDPTVGTFITTPTRELTPHPFKFTILETETCKNVNSSMPLLLVIVHSAPKHYDFRRAIRETWANKNATQYGLDYQVEMRILFTMGSIPGDQKTMEEIKQESQIHRDIIQENFTDTYKNLTHKVVMWLKWATFYCTNAFRILKIDDDVFVHRFNLMKTVRGDYDRGTAQKRTISCRVWRGMPVIRNYRSKWYVTTEEFEGRVYPPYCAGGAYMLSGDLPKLMYEKSAETRFLWVDDVFATGLLREKVGKISFEDIGRKFTFSRWDYTRLENMTENALYIHLRTRSKPHYDWWERVLREYGLQG